VKSREKLAEWVRSLGVTDPNISPNHAWRHTFKRRAARAGIERHIRDAMCGHKPRDVGDKYETPTVEDMAVALRKFPRYGLGPRADV
jgi:integrase